MGSFTASLRTMGDRRGLPATIHLDNGRLRIALGEESLGEWGLDEIRLEPTPTGYRMAAEGDQILIEMEDTAAFEDALSDSGRKRRRKPASVKAEKQSEKTRTPTATKTAAVPRKKVEKPPKERSSASLGAKVLSATDTVLAAAERRWGSLLPDWMFTRVMFGAVFALLLLTIIVPGWVSTFMLIVGVLVVMLGAVLYTDSMLASRWLPGRMAPMHVLISGVTVLMLGVLLGVLAN